MLEGEDLRHLEWVKVVLQEEEALDRIQGKQLLLPQLELLKQLLLEMQAQVDQQEIMQGMPVMMCQ